MKKTKKWIVCIVFIISLVCLCSVPAFALTFNGSSSAAGDGSSTTNSRGGYAIPNMLANNRNRAVGYRFTLIDAVGNSVNGC